MDSIIYFAGLNVCLFCIIFLSTRLFKNSSLQLVFRRVLLFASVVFLLGLLVSPVQATIITEFSFPTGFSPRPYGVAVESPGKIWFTEEMGNKIGKLEGGTISEWLIPTAGASPRGIAIGPEIKTGGGTFIWFTEYTTSRIGRFNPGTNEFHEWILPPNSNPWSIVVDPIRLAVWFTLPGTGWGYNKIGKLNYTESPVYMGWQYTEYQLPIAGSGPLGITLDRDGFVWFTEYAGNRIGRFNPWTYAFTEWRLPYDTFPPGTIYTGARQPYGIAVDADGFVWFTETGSGGNKIGKLNPWTYSVTEILIPTEGCAPHWLAIDTDRNIWFTESTRDKIGRYTPGTNTFVEYQVPTSGALLEGIAIESLGTVWFAESAGNKIGRLRQPEGPAITTQVPWIDRATMTTWNTATTFTNYAYSSSTTSYVQWLSSATSTTQSIATSSATAASSSTTAITDTYNFLLSGTTSTRTITTTSTTTSTTSTTTTATTTSTSTTTTTTSTTTSATTTSWSTTVSTTTTSTTATSTSLSPTVTSTTTGTVTTTVIVPTTTTTTTAFTTTTTTTITTTKTVYGGP